MTTGAHSLRERRVPLRKPAVGYMLAWKCACGTDFGGTKEGMSRTKARELHRVHKLTALSVQEIADGVEEVAYKVDSMDVVGQDPAEHERQLAQKKSINEVRETLGFPPIEGLGDQLVGEWKLPQRNRWQRWRALRKARSMMRQAQREKESGL